MASLLSFGSRLFDQVNPLDNGRTFKQRTPVNNQSALGQATHNGLTNFLGNSTLKPVQAQLNATQNSPIGNIVRLGAANLTHNDAAMHNAIVNLRNNFNGPKLEVSTIKNGKRVFSPKVQEVVSNATLGASAGRPALDTAKNVKLPKVTVPTARLTPLGQEGKFRLPNLGGQNLHYSSSNGRTTVSGKANQVRAQLTKLNQVGAVGKNVPSEEELKMGKALGMTPKQVAKANTQTDIKLSAPKKVTQKLTQNTSKDLGDSKNPLVGKVELPKVPTGDAGQAHLNAQFVAQHEQRIGLAAQSELAKLSTKDQKLMRNIQINGVQKLVPKAENPTQFVKTEQALRNYYDLRHAYDRSLGIPTPYRQNYLRDIIPKQEVPGNFPAKGGNLSPGYTQQKTVPGATPVAEGLARDIAGSSFNHAKLTYAKGLEEAFPNQISRGSPIVGPEGVTQQLTTPYGNELFATRDLANKINERGVSAPATGALGKYDKANALMKYVKLSGGAFHAFTEYGNFVGQQLMSGKLFTEPGSAGKVVRAFFSPGSFNNEVARLRNNGVFDKASLSGLTWKPGDIKADVNVTPHGVLTKYTGIKSLHDATFQRELPLVKLLQFEQKTRGLDLNNPADLLKARQSANAINKGIGGINRVVQGLSPKQARVVARGILATDFTEGKIRTVVSAISKGGVEGRYAREMIAGKALVFAGLATGGAALTGELKGKDASQIATNIIGNLANPTYKSGKNTVSFPATHISEFTKPFASFVDGSKDKFTGLKHYGSSRLAAVPAEATQLVNNLDYTGNHIYGKNTKKNGGKPISPSGTALNVAKTVLPIPFAQGTSAVQGKQSPLATAGNIAGLRIYPTPATKSTVPKLTKRQTIANNPDELTRWQGMTAKARKNVQSANPEKYIRDQQLKIQQETAKGQTTQAFKDQRDVNKTQIYKNYDRNLVQAYNLNATDFKAFVASAPSDQVAKLQQLDAQLVNAGLVAKTKFTRATGYASRAKSTSKAFTKRGKNTFSSKGFKTATSKIAKPKGVTTKKLAQPSFKTSSLKKLSVSKIPISYKGRKV